MDKCNVVNKCSSHKLILHRTGVCGSGFTENGVVVHGGEQVYCVEECTMQGNVLVDVEDIFICRSSVLIQFILGFGVAVKFEARLQRGRSVVYQTPESGVEFTVNEGKISLEIISSASFTN